MKEKYDDMERNEGIRVSNDLLEVIFLADGSLSGIVDKGSGRRYLTETLFSGLFRVTAPEGDWEGRHADSRDQANPSIRRVDGNHVEITYDALSFIPRKADFDFNFASSGQTARNAHFASIPEPIHCRVQVELAGEDVVLRMDVENRGQETVTDVIFPIVSGFGMESQAMDLTWPVQTQIVPRIVEHPYRTLGGDNHKEWFHEKRFLQTRYPLELATAWIDFSDAEGGVSFDIRDPEPQLFDFCIEKTIRKGRSSRKENRTGLFMAPAFYPTIAPGGRWTSPDCILRVHSCDWHHTARLHRDWLEGVLPRPASPKGFLEQIGWNFHLMKLQDGTDIRTYDDLPAMADAALAAGIRQIMVFGLYQDGHDNDYTMAFQPNTHWGGAERFTQAVREVRAKGVTLIPFFNGTLMDSRLLEKDPGLLSMCVLGRTGSRYGGQDWSRPVFDFPQNSYKGYTMSRNNHLYEVCVTGREGAAWFKETVRRISQDYGTGSIQLDQLAHKAHVCHDPAHGHASPQSAYTMDMKTLLRAVRRQIRDTDAEGVMIGEGFSDLTASHCDGFWNWNQMDNPRVVRYSVPWMRFSSEIDALEYGEANFCFAHGVLLDLKIEGGVGILSDFPDFQKHLAKLSSLKRRLYESYAAADFEDQDGITVDAEPGVVAKVFRNREKRIGAVLVANTTDAWVQASVSLDFETLSRVRVGFDGIRRKASRKEVIELTPYEVVALEFRTA
jgi:hypothetical protein